MNNQEQVFNGIFALLERYTNGFSLLEVKMFFGRTSFDLKTVRETQFHNGMNIQPYIKCDRELFVYASISIRFMYYTCFLTVRNLNVPLEYHRFDTHFPTAANRPHYIAMHPPGMFANPLNPIFTFLYHLTTGFSSAPVDDVDARFGDYFVTIMCRERTQTFAPGFEMMSEYLYRNGDVQKVKFNFQIHNHELKIMLKLHARYLFSIVRHRPYETVQMPPINYICDMCLENKVNCAVLPCNHFICDACIYMKRTENITTCHCTIPMSYVVHFIV